MISSIQFSTYQQIASMQTHIDNIIQEAMIAKSQISSGLTPSLASLIGIGQKVNILA